MPLQSLQRIEKRLEEQPVYLDYHPAHEHPHGRLAVWFPVWPAYYQKLRRALTSLRLALQRVASENKRTYELLKNYQQ